MFSLVIVVIYTSSPPTYIWSGQVCIYGQNRTYHFILKKLKVINVWWTNWLDSIHVHIYTSIEIRISLIFVRKKRIYLIMLFTPAINL